MQVIDVYCVNVGEKYSSDYIYNASINMGKDNYKTAILEKGDCIIWHPKLPHGGSMINNTSLFRRSIVTHNVPINKGISSSKTFFSTNKSDEYKQNIFKNDIKYMNYNGRKYFYCYELEGKPIVQSTYS